MNANKHGERSAEIIAIRRELTRLIQAIRHASIPTAESILAEADPASWSEWLSRIPSVLSTVNAVGA